MTSPSSRVREIRPYPECTIGQSITPSGRRTRNASGKALSGSGKCNTPKGHTTASRLPSPNWSCSAPPTRNLADRNRCPPPKSSQEKDRCRRHRDHALPPARLHSRDRNRDRADASQISADGGYNAWQVDAAVAKVPRLRLAIVKRSDDMKGFVVPPRRWVVERTFPGSDATGVSPRFREPRRIPGYLRYRFPLSSLPSGGSSGRRS